MQTQLNNNLKSSGGQHRISTHRSAGQGIKPHYIFVCEFCDETQNLTTIKRADRDIHVCMKHGVYFGA